MQKFGLKKLTTKSFGQKQVHSAARFGAKYAPLTSKIALSGQPELSAGAAVIGITLK